MKSLKDETTCPFLNFSETSTLENKSQPLGIESLVPEFFVHTLANKLFCTIYKQHMIGKQHSQ